MTNDKAIQGIYQQVRAILIRSRSRAWQAVNAEMVACYWQIGRLIVEEEQRGETRAEYGKRLIQDLSVRLTNEFGRGFHQRNLWFMRNFYLAYPKVERTAFRIVLDPLSATPSGGKTGGSRFLRG